MFMLKLLNRFSCAVCACVRSVLAGSVCLQHMRVVSVRDFVYKGFILQCSHVRAIRVYRNARG